MDYESGSEVTPHDWRENASFVWRDVLRHVPFFLAFALTIILAAEAFAAEVIPPKPDRYFNDYAGVTTGTTAQQLNDHLAQFERDTSTQVVVAVYPRMQTDSDVADYTRRVAQSWGVGQKENNNGVVLFVFVQDRKMFIQTGYGAEGALPDATAFDITERYIKPQFRSGNYDRGLTIGVTMICQALTGEYKGGGLTNAERQRRGKNNNPIPFFIFLILFFIIFVRIARAQRRGYHYTGFGGPYIGGWGGGGGGWSSGGGGGGGGSFGGFSGGGGSFGGGGAGSSW